MFILPIKRLKRGTSIWRTGSSIPPSIIPMDMHSNKGQAMAGEKYFFTQLQDFDGNLFLHVSHTIPAFNDIGKETLLKHSVKRRKCWKPAFSPFPTVFSAHPSKKNLFLSHIYFIVCKRFQFGSV